MTVSGVMLWSHQVIISIITHYGGRVIVATIITGIFSPHSPTVSRQEYHRDTQRVVHDCQDYYKEYWNPIYQERTGDKHEQEHVDEEMNVESAMSISCVSFNSEVCEGSYDDSHSKYDADNNNCWDHGRFRRSSLICLATNISPEKVENENNNKIKQSAECTEHFSYLYTLDDLRGSCLRDMNLNNITSNKAIGRIQDIKERQSRYNHNNEKNCTVKLERDHTSVYNLNRSLTNFIKSTSQYRIDLLSNKHEDIISNSQLGVAPPRSRSGNIASWVNLPPTLNTCTDDQWRELTKSLTSLRLSRNRLDHQDEIDGSKIGSDINNDNNNNVNTMTRAQKVKAKSVSMLNKIKQEQGRHDEEVN